MVTQSGTALENPALRGFALLTRPAFLFFWLGNFMTFGTRELWILAQSWLILDLSDSQALVGAATGLAAIPTVAFGLLSGYLADRYGPRLLLLVTRAVLVILAITISSLAITGIVQVWHVVLLGIAMGTAIALSGSAMQTLVTSLVTRDRLQAANALNQLTFGIARAAGPVLGGFLIAAYDVGAAFLALVGICLFAVLATAAIPVSGRPENPTRSGAFQQITEGLRYVASKPVIMWTLFMVFMAMFAATVLPLVSVYARDVLLVGETGFGWLFAAFAFGQVAAAVVLTLTGGFRRHGLVLVLVGVQWGIAMVVFAFSRSYPLSLAAMFFMGVTNTTWFTSVVTLLQVSADREKLGRVMALFAIVVQTAILGWAIGGWAGELIGNELMVVLSAAILIGTYLIAYASSRQLRARY